MHAFFLSFENKLCILSLCLKYNDTSFHYNIAYQEKERKKEAGMKNLKRDQEY
jgi:hypothetical protein